MELKLESFDPTREELTILAQTAKALTITDFDDPAQIEAVHKQRMVLQKTRTKITSLGKQLRDEATKFNRDVITRERELIDIIKPEETRLDQLEDAAKQHAIEKERLLKWPGRKERLAELGYKGGVNDDTVLRMMDDVQFESFIINVKAKIEAERLAVQRTEQLAREAELKRREDELEAKERKAKMEEAAKENAEREKADAEMREKNRLADLEAARLEGERLERERVKLQEETEKAEQAKAFKAKKFKVWLTLNGCNEATRGDFSIQYEGGKTVLYKRIGTYEA